MNREGRHAEPFDPPETRLPGPGVETIPMDVECIEEPIRFHLHGIEGVVENERYGEVGLRLMNAMWRVIQEGQIPTTGINHWVYLPAGRLFVGLALRDPRPVPIRWNPVSSSCGAP